VVGVTKNRIESEGGGDLPEFHAGTRLYSQNHALKSLATGVGTPPIRVRVRVRIRCRVRVRDGVRLRVRCRDASTDRHK